ncbi:TPA: hypothetical protein ACYRSU_006107, partial [Klebsiella michiganensis]
QFRRRHAGHRCLNNGVINIKLLRKPVAHGLPCLNLCVRAIKISFRDDKINIIFKLRIKI